MTERDYQKSITWDLLGTHPFTNQQAKVIRMTANGMSRTEIASYLHVKQETVKSIIRGKVRQEHAMSRCELGIFGIIERATGKRPNKDNWIAPLVGDVLFPFEKNDCE